MTRIDNNYVTLKLSWFHNLKFMKLKVKWKLNWFVLFSTVWKRTRSYNTISSLKDKVKYSSSVLIVASLPHLQGSSLSLSFQDVALQILRGAQWSDGRTAAWTVQAALLCELHHVVLWGARSKCMSESVQRIKAECFCISRNRDSPDCSWPYSHWCCFLESWEVGCFPAPAASDELQLLKWNRSSYAFASTLYPNWFTLR